ncbi:MAG: asparaginase [Magnetovibrio sp.]|nr:asparaginase [Magnetovibrio sp.]
MNLANPVLIDVTRGGVVESRHRGACVVMDTKGDIVHVWGDVEAPVFPRSSLKPVQALALIETGAADAFDVTDEEIALACASHNSERDQVSRVMTWLHRVGLDVDDLECGSAESMSLDVTKSMSRSGEMFTRAHHNCSGKHAGFLTTALHMGEPTKGYIQPDHPVQQRVTRIIEEMTGVSLAKSPCGADGCGIPVFAIPLVGLARAMVHMISSDFGEERMASTHRVIAAMAAHPHMVAGTKRFDTRMMEATNGRVLTKIGAEGVHVAMIPDYGLGVALKIDDGTMRASEQAMGSLLDRLGVLSSEAHDQVTDLIEKPIFNTVGVQVGELRGAKGFKI